MNNWEFWVNQAMWAYLVVCYSCHREPFRPWKKSK